MLVSQLQRWVRPDHVAADGSEDGREAKGWTWELQMLVP